MHFWEAVKRRATRHFASPARIWMLTSCLALVVFPLEANEDQNFISHGPILGRLSSDGIGIWARTSRSGSFAVRYGLSPGRLDRISQAVTTRLDNDNTGWIHLRGLKANTRYHYELLLTGVSGSTGRGGSFRTLPDPKAYVSAELNPGGLFNFSFEFACGNNQDPDQSVGPSLPTFKTMLERIADQIHFAILNGDWLYESERRFSLTQWRSQVNCSEDEVPCVLKVAPTLAGVWENYKHFLSQGDNLARWHSGVPSFVTYDDHEILNDVWGAGTPGLRDRRAVFRDIGVRAWYDLSGLEQSDEFPPARPPWQGEAREGERQHFRCRCGLHENRSRAGEQPACALGHGDGRSQ